MSTAPALLRLRPLEERRNNLAAFIAETSVHAPGVELVWEVSALDLAAEIFERPVIILRRERRFPGRNRRGIMPVWARAEDLADGLEVYDSRSFEHDLEELHEERQEAAIVSSRLQYHYRGSPRDRRLVRTLRTIRRFEDDVLLSSTVRFLQRDELEPGKVYYYTLFVGYTFDEISTRGLLAGAQLEELAASAPGSDPCYLFSGLTQASALATGDRPMKTFRSLPRIHQTLDTRRPEPARVVAADAEKGQLERFVDTMEAHHHMLLGLIDGAKDFHSPRRADSRLLTAMSRYVGWTLREDLDEDAQRNEIQLAPEFYRTVGTAPGIAALVNRVTNWDTRVRELVRNLVVTFDAARVERLTSGQTIYLDGSPAPNPMPPPALLGRSAPIGSVNTADAESMFRLRTRAFEDENCYTYDTRPAQSFNAGGLPSIEGWYNRQTIGIYIVPDIESEIFSPSEQFERIGRIVAEFLPIQVRAVFVLQPGVTVEEPYDATTMVGEEAVDAGELEESEDYDQTVESGADAIVGWTVFMTNSSLHLSANTAILPVNTASRSWHSAMVES